MMKILSQLEHKIGDKVYHFICDPNSPIDEVKSALIKFMQYVGQIEDQVKAQAEQPKSEEKPSESVPEQEQPKQE